jgi:hypothetical protein
MKNNMETNMKKIIITGIFLMLLFSSCEKDIDLVMPEFTPSVVIEGMIFNNRPPIVILTKNIPYETSAGYQLYESCFIHNAEITISDSDKNTYALKEIATKDTTRNFTSYIYSNDNLIGKPGYTYTLSVKTGNRTYTSQTTIPESVEIKDIWYENHPDTHNDSLKIIKVKIHDPVQKNYYRYSTEINGKQTAQPEISTLNDAFFNGTDYIKAIDSGLNNEEQDIHGGISGYFAVGDTITVNWANVDKPYYDFWTTVDFKRTQNKNPFMNPTRIVGNIKNCLGYWGGLNVDTKKVILK